MAQAWFVYLLQCGDGSLYTGVAVDVEKRFAAHTAGVGAKYTRGRGPLILLGHCGPFDRSQACQLEAELKRKKRSEKENVLRAWALAPKKKKSRVKKVPARKASSSPDAKTS